MTEPSDLSRGPSLLLYKEGSLTHREVAILREESCLPPPPCPHRDLPTALLGPGVLARGGRGGEGPAGLPTCAGAAQSLGHPQSWKHSSLGKSLSQPPFEVGGVTVKGTPTVLRLQIQDRHLLAALHQAGLVLGLGPLSTLGVRGQEFSPASVQGARWLGASWGQQGGAAARVQGVPMWTAGWWEAHKTREFRAAPKSSPMRCERNPSPHSAQRARLGADHHPCGGEKATSALDRTGRSTA